MEMSAPLGAKRWSEFGFRAYRETAPYHPCRCRGGYSRGPLLRRYEFRFDRQIVEFSGTELIPRCLLGAVADAHVDVAAARGADGAAAILIEHEARVGRAGRAGDGSGETGLRGGHGHGQER